MSHDGQSLQPDRSTSTHHRLGRVTHPAEGFRGSFFAAVAMAWHFERERLTALSRQLEGGLALQKPNFCR
jgi:hypothetical protein